MFKSSKGFTIIELIVVIAIIAVLAGIVLVNVMQYIGKSKDATIKEEASQLQTAANVWLNDPNNTAGDFSHVCGSPNFSKILSYMDKNTPTPDFGYIGCGDNSISPDNCSNSQWAVIAILNAPSTITGVSAGAIYCVDSSGNAKVLTSAEYNAGTGCSCNGQGFF